MSKKRKEPENQAGTNIIRDKKASGALLKFDFTREGASTRKAWVGDNHYGKNKKKKTAEDATSIELLSEPRRASLFNMDEHQLVFRDSHLINLCTPPTLGSVPDLRVTCPEEIIDDEDKEDSFCKRGAPDIGISAQKERGVSGRAALQHGTFADVSEDDTGKKSDFAQTINHHTDVVNLLTPEVRIEVHSEDPKDDESSHSSCKRTIGDCK